jgi:hypothetical protein
MTSVAATDGAYADDLPRISPELVLVDPELSKRVRPRVPLPLRRGHAPLPALHDMAEARVPTAADPGQSR